METIQQLTPEQIRTFRDDGYLLVEGLFSPEEVRELVDNFMQMHAGGPIPGCFEPADPEEADDDILKLYPAHDAPAQGKPVGPALSAR